MPYIMAVDTSEAGIGVLAIKAVDPAGANVELNLKKAKDAQRKVMAEFSPKSVGKYQLSVKWSRVQVPQSPVIVQIV